MGETDRYQTNTKLQSATRMHTYFINILEMYTKGIIILPVHATAFNCDQAAL